MKVLHVIPSYEPAWAFGGTVTATSNLCRVLAKKGVDVTVYTTDADGKGGHLDVPLNEPVNLGGVKVWYFHCDLLPKDAFYSRGLAKKLKETVKDFDIVHVSAIWQWIQVNVYKACKNLNKPYIVTAHGSFNPWPWKQKIFKKRIYWHLFGKRTIESSNAIHFTSDEERIKSFDNIKLLKRKESFVIPNGVDINIKRKNTDIRGDLKIDKKAFLLLFIGRINKIKGIELVIQALKTVKGNNFIFLIVGPKEDKKYYDFLVSISTPLRDRIIFHHEIPKNKTSDFYFSSDLFVLPSYSENFGYTVVEAMACGTPVLISRNVCIWREVEEDKAGFIVNQNPIEIAEVIKECIENPKLLKELSINARKSAEKRYDINKVADLMIKAYEDVLTGRRSPELKWM